MRAAELLPFLVEEYDGRGGWVALAQFAQNWNRYPDFAPVYDARSATLCWPRRIPGGELPSLRSRTPSVSETAFRFLTGSWHGGTTLRSRWLQVLEWSPLSGEA